MGQGNHIHSSSFSYIHLEKLGAAQEQEPPMIPFPRIPPGPEAGEGGGGRTGLSGTFCAGGKRVKAGSCLLFLPGKGL